MKKQDRVQHCALTDCAKDVDLDGVGFWYVRSSKDVERSELFFCDDACVRSFVTDPNMPTIIDSSLQVSDDKKE